MEDSIERKMRPHHLMSSFFLGMAVTLLLTSRMTWPSPYSVPAGWLGLWLVATIGCLSIGALLLLGLPWRQIPMEARRGPALVYLAAAAVTFLGLAVMVISLGGDRVVLCLPILAGIGVAFLTVYLYRVNPKRSEELFP